MPCVFALGVLADNDPVEASAGAVAQGRGGAAQDAGGTHVGVLLEGLAEGEAQAPEGDVVRDVWRGVVFVSHARKLVLCSRGAGGASGKTTRHVRSSGEWSHIPGAPTAPNNMASNFLICSNASSGKYFPFFL